MAARERHEIMREIDRIDPDAAAGGPSQWPDMTYEQGVEAALRWAAGETSEKPMDE